MTFRSPFRSAFHAKAEPRDFVRDGFVVLKESMKALFSLCLVAMSAIVFARSPEDVTKKVTTDKSLVLEITIPASRAAVWQAFTTSEGLSTWLTPAAVVDLRPGGE